jgi:dipeptidyl aminopeptidase/acylaminoacyl peptidase
MNLVIRAWQCRARAWVTASLLFVSVASATDTGARGATVPDAINMVRIQYSVTPDDKVAAISPDGTQAAFVTWRGDLERNTNVYELRTVDLRLPLKQQTSRVVLTRLFPGERVDQVASPIGQLRYVSGDKVLTYLGRDAAGVAQAYRLDLATGEETQLTRHPTAVRTFTVDADGKLLAFSAIAFPDDAADQRLEEDGVFLWESDVFPVSHKFFSASSALFRLSKMNAVRQFFLTANGREQLIFDSRQSRPVEPLDMKDPKVAGAPSQSLAEDMVLGHFSVLPAAPNGRQLLIYPYLLAGRPLHPERYAYYMSTRMNAYARRVAPQVGIIDVATGKIEPILDAPSPQFERYESGPPMWSPDGKSVVLYTLFADRPADAPAWVEVEVATRRIVPLGLGKDSRPVGWASDGRTLVLSIKGDGFGQIRRAGDGKWSKPLATGRANGFNSNWTAATNGKVVLGVSDALRTAPELTAYDPTTKRSTRLTDLNPQLADIRFGEVTAYHWRSKPTDPADGFLIKPIDYRPGTRYPLVILLDDGTLGREGEPFLFDGAWQLSSHATQMLAAQGFMVLYKREPPLRDVIETPAEPERIRQDTEQVVAQLDREGLIDPARVGISGWSRAGFYTSYLVIHSSIKFAAAINTDGGASEYTDGMRPFTDQELAQIRTPVMFQSHGLWSLTYHGYMADRMNHLDRPTEMLYFESASHSITRPQHRLRSLGASVDWWRFWLKGEQDLDPAKALQYAHWRELRSMQERQLERSSSR